MPLEFLISGLVTLLVVVDPIGLAPTFLGVTDGSLDTLSPGDRAARQPDRRRHLGRGGTRWRLAAAPTRRLAAGLPDRRRAAAVLDRLRDGVRAPHRAQVQRPPTAITEDHIRNVAAFPLAIPLMAGPGALTATHPAGRSGRGPPGLRLGSAGRDRRLVIASCLVVFLLAVPIAQAARRHRQYCADAAARRDPGGAGGAVRHRRRASGVGCLSDHRPTIATSPGLSPEARSDFNLKNYEPCGA